MKMTAPVIDGADECPWCIPIVEDVVKCLSEETIGEIGRKLFVAYWDLDRIILTKEPPKCDDDFREDYSIRTWNISDNGVVDWTFFKIIEEPDGGSHGEVLCDGSIDC